VDPRANHRRAAKTARHWANWWPHRCLGVAAASQTDCQMKLTFYVCKEVDYSKAPDVVAVSCRGVHRYMVSWELHGRNFKPTCRCGWPLKVNRWTSAQAEGKARPMLKGGAGEPSPPVGCSSAPSTSWRAQRQAVRPEASAKPVTRTRGGSPSSPPTPFFLSQVEAQLGRQYPVDPAWLVRGSAFDMDAFLTRNFESIMVTYLNGDSLAKKLKVGGCVDQRTTTRT
jgi:hypothetical protein